ncbi:hypothetical protein CCACVL1_12230 [Corchorus capsularis]|uniref:Uncharacterized protein n=1 Tax=Corchorus capsularis TaxID=210143 RepID=A0A1R3IGP3_COCAP|nr:hypothetical protein CCACVL1_12230 [Corchorus capsularis]
MDGTVDVTEDKHQLTSNLLLRTIRRKREQMFDVQEIQPIDANEPIDVEKKDEYDSKDGVPLNKKIKIEKD